MSKKLRIPILLFLLFIVVMLFLTDFLMGRIHHEFENPYSRAAKIVETRHGFTRTTLLPKNEMELFLENELKQPIPEKWIRSGHSYIIPRFSFQRQNEIMDIPPIALVTPRIESDFMHYIPQNSHVQMTVMRSLYTDRKEGTDAASTLYNKRLDETEVQRAKLIIYWDQYVRNDTTVMRDQWWRQNAVVFGVNPDGTPLAEKIMVDRKPLKHN